ncbi:MAG: LemA family protein [Lachnospiraceae bacterium]|jgi:LemA protein|nr:LemA family protein [Lachnospiraceae bacterium]
MDGVTIVVIVVVAVIVLGFGWWISTMNGLRQTKVKIEEASSGIDVALTKRYDVLTKMVDVAKSYATFEKQTILEAIKLRKGMSISEKNDAAEKMGDVQRELNFLAENYPQLHSNENFRQLQIAVMDVEEHLQGARRAYNANVSTLNQKIVSFPTSIVAGAMGITREAFFEAESTKRNDVNVKIDI